MKKLHFIVKFFVAFIMAMFAVALCIRFDASDNTVIAVYLGVAILTMLALGAFDVKGCKGKQGVKYDGRRNYGQAAVFVGTACLFLGTPKECEELTDDLWHRGIQAEMSEITGEELEFNIL